MRAWIPDIDLQYALRELVLIVSSILIAFALNTWWASKKQESREQAYLRQMLADTRSYRKHLTASIRHDQRMKQCAEQMLAFIHSREASPPRDSLATWLIHAVNFSDVRPIEGTFETLIQTGDINLIEDDSLRRRLVTATGYMEHTLRKLAITEDKLLDTFKNLQREIDYHELLPYGSDIGLSSPSYHRFPLRFDELRQSESINGAMTTGYTFASIRLIYLQRLRREIADIEQLLEITLAER